MAKLAVNVDHVATLRQARGTLYPDPVTAAMLAELAGVDGIVVHLREDRRHIKDRDVKILRQTIKSKLILEMAQTQEMVGIAIDVKPDVVTLVPEKREELTTEEGINLKIHKDITKETIRILKNKGIGVSIFMDPDPDQVKIAKQINADSIEIHTGYYCDAKTSSDKKQAFDKIIDTIKVASKLEIGINAGHGIDYQTIKDFRSIKEIYEFSIGHSIISRSILVGIEKAVREMIELIKQTV